MRISLPRPPRASRSIRILIAAVLTALVWFRLQAFDDADARPASAQVAAMAPAADRVVVDGAFADWSESAHALRSDGAYVYVRFQLPEERTLQGGTATTRVLFDLDADAATGQVRKDDDGPMGVDLEVTFSPPNPKRGGSPGTGVAIQQFTAKGPASSIGHARAGLLFAPSFAATNFELRLARRAELNQDIAALFQAAGKAAFRVLVLAPDGKEIARSARIEGALPPLDSARESAPIAPPVARADGVRVVTWNVEKEAPMKNPAPFQRILKALAPDVVLCQEWTSKPGEIEAWFKAQLPERGTWRVHTHGELGVAIATTLPLEPLTDGSVMPARKVNGKIRPVRFVAARVETKVGPVVFGTTHLKCCGTKDSPEDELRQLEADAINEFVRVQLGKSKPMPVVITGDMNLVGTRNPLDQIARDLDVDGSTLTITDAYTATGAGNDTWRSEDGQFSPGRLDYVLYADAALAAANAYVFDSAQLDDATRASLGVQAMDSLATDHRAVLVDLVPAPPPAPLPKPIRAAELRELVTTGGSPVLVNFWATWCGPCVAELPDLARVARECEARGLRLVLVGCDAPEDAEAARKLLTAKGLAFQTYIKGELDEAFIPGFDPDWNGSLPTTFVFDASGKKVALHEGSATYQEFLDLVAPVLASK
ncbi:MAG: redoxin domain-containing protein [Planctomycetes bacterium]|nr:redoxin domain-containing protein [Planctomycetota bacterium]